MDRWTTLDKLKTKILVYFIQIFIFERGRGVGLGASASATVDTVLEIIWDQKLSFSNDSLTI